MPDPQSTRTIHADRTTDPVHGQPPPTLRTLDGPWQDCLDRLKARYPELRPYDVAEWTRDQVEAATRYIVAVDASSKLMASGGLPVACSVPSEPVFLHNAAFAARMRNEQKTREDTVTQDEALSWAGLAIVKAFQARRQAEQNWQAANILMKKALAPCEHREGFGLPMVINGHVITQGPAGFDVAEVRTKIDREG